MKRVEHLKHLEHALLEKPWLKQHNVIDMRDEGFFSLSFLKHLFRVEYDIVTAVNISQISDNITSIF